MKSLRSKDFKRKIADIITVAITVTLLLETSIVPFARAATTQTPQSTPPETEQQTDNQTTEDPTEEESTTEPTQSAPQEPAFTKKELTHLRTENSKTFQIDVSEYQTEVHSGKIHFQSGNAYFPVDNNVISESNGKYAYRNRANDFIFRAGAKLSYGAKYQGKKGVCEFRLVGAEGAQIRDVSPRINNNIITYPEIYPGADLEFTIHAEGVYTEIVAKNPSAMLPTYTFELTNCNQTIFDKAVVYDGDSGGNVATNITYVDDEKTGQKNKHITLTPNYASLGTITGEVRIDPSVTIYTSMDTFVTPSTTWTGNGTRRAIPIGSYTDYTLTPAAPFSKSRGLIDFNLGSIPTGAYVTGATLRLWHYGTNTGNGALYVAKVTSAWNETTVWQGPKFTGNYGSTTFPYYNSNFTAQARDITLNPILISELKSSSMGIMVRNVTETQKGVVVCSRNIPSGPCKSGMSPTLIVNYFKNNAPFTPKITAPTDNQTFSGSCDESQNPATGICRTTTSVTTTVTNVGDGDIAPGDFKLVKLIYSGANNFEQTSTSSGTVDFTGDLADGTTTLTAISQDNLNLWGNPSPSINVITDTTPPEVPLPNPLPTWTQGVGVDQTIQVEVSAPETTDNVSLATEISYQVEYSTDSGFATSYTKPFQLANPLFEIGPKGADGIDGTADDLQGDQLFYFRIKAMDNLSNISAWSSAVSTTVDGVLPAVSNLTSSETRFSPSNATSVGIKDQVTLTFDYVETHPQTASIEVYDSTGALINTITQDISANEGITTTVPVSITWDGTDSTGGILADGIYTVKALVTDKAGNINTAQPSTTVIVDNNEANITISSPIDQYWTALNSTNITGQVKSPNDPGEEDQDLQDLEISNDNVLFSPLPYDLSGIFSTTKNLSLGTNTFYLKTTDTVGNLGNKQVTVNYETTQPTVTNIGPFGLTNNLAPTILFTVTDPDPTGDLSQTSDIPTGSNPPGLNLSLTYEILDTIGVPPYPTMSVTKDLIKDGVNLEPSLVSDLVCSPSAGATTSTKNGLSSANQVDCTLDFIAELQPDSTYTINIQAEDNAQNQVQNSITNFTLDSHIYNLVTSPVQSGIYSNSTVLFTGKISKGSTLEIANSQLGQTATFTVDETLNGTGSDGQFIMSDFTVTCGEFIDVDGRTDTPAEEVCSWSVTVQQDFAPIDQDTLNNNTITATDPAGNTDIQTRDIIVNIFNFDLTITGDLEYISPNGDGNQDGIVFTHSATNSTDPANPPSIASWTIEIKDAQGNTVRTYSGTDFLPSDTFFDGKDSSGNWLADGDYTYTLSVVTLDGASLTTAASPIYARTELLDTVVITSPKTGHVTTSGVISVQGQAPINQPAEGTLSNLRGDITVTICVDMITTPNTVQCDLSEQVTTNEFGYFSSLLSLPRVPNQTQTEHIITAVASDTFGNSTTQSNSVQVILDTVEPFTYVTATPTLTGVTTDADYLEFLNGNISIDQIRNVTLEAGVTENTQQVELSFANYVNVSQQPGTSSYNLIGTLTNLQETNSTLNPFGDPTVKNKYPVPLGDASIQTNNCANATGCTWKHILPIDSSYSGIYEVKFKGLKGETIQEMTAGFTVDGTIPAQPLIMLVEEWNPDTNSWVPLSPVEGQYSTNNTLIRLRGAAEPGVKLDLFDGTNYLSSINSVSTTGTWEFTVDLSTLLTSADPTTQTFDFNLVAYELDAQGNPFNTVVSTNRANVLYDSTLPSLSSIVFTPPYDTLDGYVKTGDRVDYTVTATEKLKYADIVKEDGFVRLLNNLSGYTLWGGGINADRPFEGWYYPDIVIRDLAGNSYLYSGQLWQSYGLGDWNLKVDNTIPDPTTLDTTGWGVDDGIKADGIEPETGRLNPDYVVRADRVSLHGFAEKDQRVELYVNKSLHTVLTATDNSNCKTIATDTSAPDGLVTKSGTICPYSYEYVFPGTGANNEFGIPTQYYMFQVRVKDKARNFSVFTDQIVVYHDTQAPRVPEISNVASASYNPIVDWQYNDSTGSSITKDLSIDITSYAEQFADMEYRAYTPAGVEYKYDFFKNSSTGKATRTFALGDTIDDRSGCVEIVNGRRIGICQDGYYTFRLKATDAPGNTSAEKTIRVERDTVSPGKPTLQVVPNDAAQTIYLKITGEPGATAIINDKTFVTIPSSGTVTALVVSSAYWNYSTKYSFKVVIRDRAQNTGAAEYASYTTPAPVVRGATTCSSTEGGRIAYPFEGMYRVTSEFGWRDNPLTTAKDSSFHNGMDFGTPRGTEILSSAKGKVIWRSDNYTKGYGIIVQHPEIGISTLYWHFDKNLVKPYLQVETGSVLGLAGSTGYATGPHLHFITRTGGPGTEMNPREWLGDCQSKTSDSKKGKKGSKKAKPEDATKKFVSFINKYLDDDSSIINSKTGKKTQLKKIDNLYKALTPRQWCGVWVQDLSYVREKNGSKAWGGLLVLNPYSNDVVLVRGAIYEKYKSVGGPCSALGVPRLTAGHYTDVLAGVPNKNSRPFGFKITSAKYQRFENDYYSRNSIYWYRWSEWGKRKETAKTVVNEIANKYEDMGGTWSSLGFPTQDRHKKTSKDCGTTGRRQVFDHGRIYTSTFGTYQFRKGGFLKEYIKRGEVTGQLGWPKGERYSYYAAQRAKFEKGTLSWSIISSKIINPQGCLSAKQKNDAQLGAPKEVRDLFHARERELFSDFNRAPGNNGIIHKYCGGWVVDYTDTLKKNGEKNTYSWMIYKQGYGVRYMTYNIGQTYWKNGGCDRFGFPTSDTRDTADKKGVLQTFRKAGQKGYTDIYWHNTNKKAQGKWISGAIRMRFIRAGGTKSYLDYPSNIARRSESDCGTAGYHQEFLGGKIYSSKLGTVDMEYARPLYAYWAYGETTGILGWPREDEDWTGYITKQRKFESGILTVNIVTNSRKAEFTGCGAKDERAVDKDSDAPQTIKDLIYRKEDQKFKNFLRTNDANGTIHSFCGGWIVDYSYVEYTDGTKEDKTWIITNRAGTAAYILTGKFATKYWNSSGCSSLGLPNSDYFDAKHNKTWALVKTGKSLKQKFEKGDIYNYEVPKAFTTDEFTYIVRDEIKKKYDNSGTLGGKYGFPTSDQYLTSGYICQNFDEGKICNTTSTDEELILGRLFELGGGKRAGEISEMCGHKYQRFYDIGGRGKSMLMIVDGQVRIIYGKVYEHYNYNGECRMIGVPQNDTSEISPYKTTGKYQTFKRDDGTKVRIYAPDKSYDSYHIWGGLLDEISEQGGTKNVGFITTGIAGMDITSCDTQAKYWKTENGRIYKVDDSYYGIMKSNKIGRYFHDNGGHSKFGVPTGDWGDWGLGLNQSQNFQKTTLKMNFIGSIVAEPEAPFYCPGEEPVQEETTTEEDSGGEDPTPVDPKEQECLDRGMVKYVNPNDEEDIVCAKIIDAPYINQYLNVNGEEGDPSAGRVMCGANAVTMGAAAAGKLENTDYTNLKTYVYQDNELELGENRACTKANDPWDSTKNMKDIGGTFSITGNSYSANCNENSWDGMALYFSKLEIEIVPVTKNSGNYEAVGNWEKIDHYNKVVESIDNGNGIIEGIGGPIGHIILIKGYTEDKRLIVNDSYTDLMLEGNRYYSLLGNGAIYDHNNDGGYTFNRMLIFKITE